MHDQVNRPIPRRLRLGAFYALSGVALALSVAGLIVVGSALLYLGPFTLRFLPFFLHPTNDTYGISALVWVVELVALVISAALAVGFLYLSLRRRGERGHAAAPAAVHATRHERHERYKCPA